MDDGTWIPWCSTDYGSTNISYENSWFFRLLWTIKGQIHTFEKLYAGPSDIFGGKSFGVNKKPVFGVANATFL